MGRERFIGTWRLASFEYFISDGRATYPFGQHPSGFLIYTADGYMTMTIASEGYLRLPADPHTPVPDGTADTAKVLYASFAGRYKVTETHVVHHVEVSLREDWVGSPRVREYTFVGNRLILSHRGLTVVWKRVDSAS